MVWEETIILLPDNVHYVFLSATIPNARQFAEWICHLHKQVCVASVCMCVRELEGGRWEGEEKEERREWGSQ